MLFKLNPPFYGVQFLEGTNLSPIFGRYKFTLKVFLLSKKENKYPPSTTFKFFRYKSTTPLWVLSVCVFRGGQCWEWGGKRDSNIHVSSWRSQRKKPIPRLSAAWCSWTMPRALRILRRQTNSTSNPCIPVLFPPIGLNVGWLQRSA